MYLVDGRGQLNCALGVEEFGYESLHLKSVPDHAKETKRKNNKTFKIWAGFKTRILRTFIEYSPAETTRKRCCYGNLKRQETARVYGRESTFSDVFARSSKRFAASMVYFALQQ